MSSINTTAHYHTDTQVEAAFNHYHIYMIPSRHNTDPDEWRKQCLLRWILMITLDDNWPDANSAKVLLDLGVIKSITGKPVKTAREWAYAMLEWNGVLK